MQMDTWTLTDRACSDLIQLWCDYLSFFTNGGSFKAWNGQKVRKGLNLQNLPRLSWNGTSRTILRVKSQEYQVDNDKSIVKNMKWYLKCDIL